MMWTGAEAPTLQRRPEAEFVDAIDIQFAGTDRTDSLTEEIAALVESRMARGGLGIGSALRLALRLQSLMLATDERPAPVPAVAIEDSIHPDHLVCLETGEKVVLLRRHLQQKLGITPEEYRRKWDLPPDYPLVAPDYARARARKRGLGAGVASGGQSFR